ncbi:hypothetical protein ccbrp13_16890 [Ktedonobacteria bacterium brp13]|nr:hypothetical protein ccbrp13_16890 [Ktedonobacteria bacterium brp13]
MTRLQHLGRIGTACARVHATARLHTSLDQPPDRGHRAFACEGFHQGPHRVAHNLSQFVPTALLIRPGKKHHAPVLQEAGDPFGVHLTEHLPRVVRGPGPAKMTSTERRLARFVANDRVVVTKIWDHFLSEVLPFWHGKPIRFILDCTPLRDDATIVYLGLLVHF